MNSIKDVSIVFLDQINEIPNAFDPDSAIIPFERWIERAEADGDEDLLQRAQAIVDHETGHRLLASIFAASPYLTQSLLKEVSFALDLLERGPDEIYRSIMAEFSALDAKSMAEANLMSALRVAKRRLSLTIAISDMTGQWPLEQITSALSEIAEKSLEHAWRHALAVQINRGKLPLELGDDPLVGSGLICLAMGKFGAHELNYSSDIDLIVFYDDELPAFQEVDELQQIFVRMTRTMVKLIEERTKDGYVFRTDLRLRPDAAATPPAISVTAAETYYESMGQNWERAAMLKARPVASDQDAAQGFLKRLSPFIWRKFLDFAAIQDIHSIKRQIAAHKGGTDITVAGHNLKLGRGGIREIEFYAQTQQLIWGGRNARLRVPDTVSALRELVEAGRVEPDQATELIACYRYLRRAEHRLQMIADAQTHNLPEDAGELDRYAAFLGYDSTEAFGKSLLSTLNTVSEINSLLFQESQSLGGESGGNLVFTGGDDDPGTIKTLEGLGFQNPSAVAGQIRAWHHGRYRATRSERARQLLTEWVPELLQALGKTPDPDIAFRRFDTFLAKLPAGVQLFSLIQMNPNVLGVIAQIMGLAPALAERLGQNPNLFEGLLTHDLMAPLAETDALVKELGFDLEKARDYEHILDLTRRWVNDRKFQIGVQMVRGYADINSAGHAMTGVAEAAITNLLPHVEEEFSQRHGFIRSVERPSIAVIALGKLGGMELTAGSDLDLIFIYDAPIDEESDGEKSLMGAQYFMRLAQRYLSSLNVKTAEGDLFEVDLRLRPSGNKSQIATNFETFCKYHETEAWTWERMALTRARVITGNDGLREKLESQIKSILTTERDPDKLLLDVASMRARVAKDKPAKSIWEIKLTRGGLLDVEFLLQYLQLRHASAHPEVISGNTNAAISGLQKAGVLSAEAAATLTAAAGMWRSLQSHLRLTIGESSNMAEAPAALREHLVNMIGAESFEDLEAQMSGHAKAVTALYDEIIEGPAQALKQE